MTLSRLLRQSIYARAAELPILWDLWGLLPAIVKNYMKTSVMKTVCVCGVKRDCGVVRGMSLRC